MSCSGLSGLAGQVLFGRRTLEAIQVFNGGLVNAADFEFYLEGVIDLGWVTAIQSQNFDIYSLGTSGLGTVIQSRVLQDFNALADGVITNVVEFEIDGPHAVMADPGITVQTPFARQGFDLLPAGTVSTLEAMEAGTPAGAANFQLYP